MANRNDQLAARRKQEVGDYLLHTDRPDLGVQIYVTLISADCVLAKCFLGKAARPAWFYRLTPEQLATKAARELKAAQWKLDAKAAAKAARAAATFTVKVGDVFRCSWGYDQTNVDYYQVTRMVGAQSVEIRRIAALSWGTEFMQGRSVPKLDDLRGAPMVKRLRATGDGGAAVRITSFADAYKMDPVVEGVPAYESTSWTAYA
jgi:hypothetical protein